MSAVRTTGDPSPERPERPEFGAVRSGGRLHAAVVFGGPAFVAAVAYVDPGNFATNISAGARYGYLLVWVVVVANLAAMIVQYLSAKLGVATAHDLPEVCRDRTRSGGGRTLGSGRDRRHGNGSGGVRRCRARVEPGVRDPDCFPPR